MNTDHSSGNVEWLDVSEGQTPISASALENIENKIDELDTRLLTKIDIDDKLTTANTLLSEAKTSIENLKKAIEEIPEGQAVPLDGDFNYYSIAQKNLSDDGASCLATGKNSAALGLGTVATVEGQLVIGKYNEYNEDEDNALFIIGNGTGADTSKRKNALYVTTDGTLKTENGEFNTALKVSGSNVVTEASIRTLDLTSIQLKSTTSDHSVGFKWDSNLSDDNTYLAVYEKDDEGKIFLSTLNTSDLLSSYVTTSTDAKDDTFGLIKIGYTTPDNQKQNYAVQLDSNGHAYVNVPWQNTTNLGAWEVDEDGLVSNDKKSWIANPESVDGYAIVIGGNATTSSNTTQGFRVSKAGEVTALSVKTNVLKFESADVGLESCLNERTIMSFVTSEDIMSCIKSGEKDHLLVTLGALEKYNNSTTCLIEGTPINMYDGTYKNIEDIEPGDIVLSYDPVVKKNVPAVAIASIKTGEERIYKTYSFSNGKFLTIAGRHCLYNAATGNVNYVENINNSFKLVTSNNEIVEWTMTQNTNFYGKRKKRYTLITSNNLYFANDILNGNEGHAKLNRVIDYNIELSEEIENIWQADCDDYLNFRCNIVTNPEYQAEIAEAAKKFRHADDMIKLNKSKLAASDYKTQKYAEGQLSEEEWIKSNEARINYRNIINEQEIIRKEAQIFMNETINKYRKFRTPHEVFEACCTRDNEAYELVKEYFTKEKKQ